MKFTKRRRILVAVGATVALLLVIQTITYLLFADRSMTPTLGIRNLADYELLRNKEFVVVESSTWRALNEHEKQNLTDAGEGSGYSRLHAQLHPFFLKVQQEYEFYDIFLLEPKQGRVVYSVFKEVDYGTSFLNGPYKDSNFGRGVKQII